MSSPIFLPPLPSDSLPPAPLPAPHSPQLKKNSDLAVVFITVGLPIIIIAAALCRRNNTKVKRVSDGRKNIETGREAEEEDLEASRRGVGPSPASPLPQGTELVRYQVEVGAKRSVCAICMEGFRPSEWVRAMPRCKHVFHYLCVDPYLIRDQTCPICKRDFAKEFPTDKAVVGLSSFVKSAHKNQ
ncbi:PREDICTED: E3 ubiquitin-protein ligase ATL9-like [Nelumbo nucifera]|uniref:RING-type domain-containing protein n=2 Tax=Nelumbo nucifera TaxID=4432 RepID=A0A822ZB72_NELNU|nr:PREDICTED: E3 ubiquitin-protein ligase ATL9-like [Nelumbo nucifera]DAD40699.1 TPA_asm: hypothetical protein HUJ06_015022 [Nelumbo nucifera]